METVNHNKAIRDKIPEIIEESGSKCNIKTLSDSEFLSKLEEKLNEEVAEYQDSKSPEEMADILEVIYRIAELKRISKEELEKIRVKKRDDRGGFEKNLCLINTCDNKEKS